jgi:hypothetical protein
MASGGAGSDEGLMDGLRKTIDYFRETILS